MATIHQEIPDREAFQEILNNNDDGIIIIKFGADWCQPCKLINPLVKEYFSKLPAIFTIYDLDVDDNFEIYAYLKTKKMVTGIPAILAYYKENKSFASSDSISGANEEHYKQFFNRCITKFISYKN